MMSVEPTVNLSVRLHRDYETPSMFDIVVDLPLLYVNIRRFTLGERNRPGEEPVVAHVEVSSIEEGPKGGMVTLNILHQGPTRTLKLPMMALVYVADAYVYRMPNGDRIHFFINKMHKRR